MDEQYDSADMYEAWAAGAQWVIDRVELEDGVLSVPEDNPAVEGLDWREECASWLNDFDAERDDAAQMSVLVCDHEPIKQPGCNICVCGQPVDLHYGKPFDEHTPRAFPPAEEAPT